MANASPKTAIGNPMRRAHKKSKLGCLTCKKRHVRCDELWPSCQNCLKLNLQCRRRPNDSRCTLKVSSIPYHGDMSVGTTTEPIQVMATSKAAVAVDAFPKSWFTNNHSQSPLTYSLVTHGLPAEWSRTDSSLMYGIVQLCTKMQRSNGHLLSLGGSGLPMLLESAFHYDFARYTLLNFLTMHLAHLQKSSQLHLLTQFYRIRAFATLSEALNHFSRRSADAVLATAVMLSYTSAGEREHKHLENGVAAVIGAMQPIKHLSKFPQFFRGPYSLIRPLKGHPDEPVRIVKTTKLAPDVSRAILQALQQTKALFTGLPSFMEAVQNLWFVMYNIGAGRASKMSARQQYDVHDSLRALKSIGVEVLADFGQASPPELLLMAFQELVMFVVEELRPDTSLAYFTLAKTDVIVRIHDRLVHGLAQGIKCESPALCMALMEVPYKIAIIYQRYGRIAME